MTAKPGAKREAKGSAERTPTARRREYLLREVRDFILKTGSEPRKGRVLIQVHPRLRDRARRAVYTVRVRGELVPEEWYEELRDIINRARSLLDNAMWAAAGGADTGKYSSQEKDRIKFPLAQHENEWKNFEASKHATALGADVLKDLRAIQPFATGDPVVQMFNRANNVDKHRDPLNLAIVPDALFAIVLAPGIAGAPGADDKHFTWAPLAPISNGKPLFEYQQDVSLPQLEPVDVPVALCVELDGQWIDVQNFLQDIVVYVAQACALLENGDASWAEAHRAQFAASREQVRNFQRTLIDKDPVSEMFWKARMGLL